MHTLNPKYLHAVTVIFIIFLVFLHRRRKGRVSDIIIHAIDIGIGAHNDIMFGTPHG